MSGYLMLKSRRSDIRAKDVESLWDRLEAIGLTVRISIGGEDRKIPNMSSNVQYHIGLPA